MSAWTKEELTAMDSATELHISTRRPDGVRAGTGQVSAGGVTKDVTFELADPSVKDELTATLHRKYDRFGPAPIAAITGPDVLQTTLKVLPANDH